MTSVTIPEIGHTFWKPASMGLTGILRSVLRIPLVLKVMGANGLIIAVVLALVGGGLWGENQGQLVAVLGALTVVCIVNLLLVRLALSPINHLEEVADRVSAGDFGARARPSLVSDPQLARLSDTINVLLDSLAAERQRIQRLGVEVVTAQDTERARIAGELHESIAQTLAAVRFQLTAVGAGTPDPAMQNSLATARAMIGKVMDEVRNISHSLHPRLADDLGLVIALEELAQQTGERSGLKVKVTANMGQKRVPAAVAATLFRVAQESLKSAEARAADGTAEILLYSSNGAISLEVSDNNHGLDSGHSMVDNSGNGLATIRDRVALTGGVMRIA
ncbi:MAG: histidine kinase, partial [Gemmatimonadota bacterium]|nr:histidine kinase [Gemmatimonadota bacterium]